MSQKKKTLRTTSSRAKSKPLTVADVRTRIDARLTAMTPNDLVLVELFTMAIARRVEVDTRAAFATADARLAKGGAR